MGQQVSHLEINCNLDMHLILSLPRLFPKVKYLYWNKEWIDDIEETVEYPSPAIYQLEFKKWKHLEHVKNYDQRHHFPAVLLGSAEFLGLGQLDIRFPSCTSKELIEVDTTILLLESLINQLVNAPALEVLKLHYVQFDLIDVELLYSALPKLQQLEIAEAYLTIEESVPENVAPADNLKSITLIWKAWTCMDDMEELTTRWHDYVSRKYKKLNQFDLRLHQASDVPMDTKYPENTLIKVLANAPHITTLASEVHGLSPSVIDFIDYSGIELEYIKMWFLNTKNAVEELNALRSYSQVNNIEALTMAKNQHATYERIMANKTLLKLSSHLTNLTYLKIDGATYGGGYTLLVGILKNLPLLETLFYLNLDFTDNNRDTTTTQFYIKNLNLGIAIRLEDRTNVVETRLSMISNLHAHS